MLTERLIGMVRNECLGGGPIQTVFSESYENINHEAWCMETFYVWNMAD